MKTDEKRGTAGLMAIVMFVTVCQVGRVNATASCPVLFGYNTRGLMGLERTEAISRAMTDPEVAQLEQELFLAKGYKPLMEYAIAGIAIDTINCPNLPDTLRVVLFTYENTTEPNLSGRILYLKRSDGVVVKPSAAIIEVAHAKISSVKAHEIVGGIVTPSAAKAFDWGEFEDCIDEFGSWVGIACGIAAGFGGGKLSAGALIGLVIACAIVAFID